MLVLQSGGVLASVSSRQQHLSCEVTGVTGEQAHEQTPVKECCWESASHAPKEIRLLSLSKLGHLGHVGELTGK